MATMLLRLLPLVVLLFRIADSHAADYYKSLGVPKSASAPDIKKAFRKLALKHHPDKGGDEAKFKEITEAYDVLGDEEKRNNYNQFGSAGGAPGNPFGGGGNPFAGASPFQGGRTPFSQGNGDGFSFEWFGQQPSGSGGGRGAANDSLNLGDILQQMMGGRGGRPQHPQQSPFGGFGGQQQAPPPRSTRYHEQPLRCTLEQLATGATKRVKVSQPIMGQDKSKVYSIPLKKGWKAGTKIKYPPTRDGFDGMTFIIKERKHAFLQRKGNDLLYRGCKLTALQAERGCRLKIPLPDGELFMLQVSDNLPIENGQTLTVPGKGMPIKGGPERGNLEIKFSIMVDA